MESLDDIDDIKPTLSASSELPIIDANRYTIAEGENTDIKIFSKTPVTLKAITPENEEVSLELENVMNDIYTCVFTPEAGPGVYTLEASNEAGYKAEAMITERKPWSWYAKAARQAAVDAPQKGTSHGESYYGMYSAYIAKKYFPDSALDAQVDLKWDEIYPLMHDTKTGLPTSWQNRIQNHSTTLGIFVDRYEATGNMDDIEQAVVLAEFLLTKQGTSGGYYNGGEDYTSVIYPAKSIMELIYVEKQLKDDPALDETQRGIWLARYDKHFASVTRAMDNLVNLDGHFDTEGQATFEDGANSCSATQLSEFALMFPEGSSKRKKYTDAAVKIVKMHTSHQQSQIPDSRMNGGTLRFWEAQYDVEMGLTSTAPKMMNSPHGWTAWSIYADFNLYELTGDEQYLRRGMNALGSCAQLMSFDGDLRWAFITDPVRDTKMFVKDEEASTGSKIIGKHVNEVIGEQYINMISTWWRAPKNTWVPGYTAMGGAVTQGAACDNDVHEIFKCLGEVALTKAYVMENEDGTYTAYYAKAEMVDGKLVISPEEDVVSNVSVKVNKETNVEVNFYDESKESVVSAGNPIWITTDENTPDLSAGDRNSSLRDLGVDNGIMTPMFESNITEYEIQLKADEVKVNITPVADSDLATNSYNGDFIESGSRIEVETPGSIGTKTIDVKVTSEYSLTTTVYRIHLIKGSDYQNIAPKATATAPELTGAANNPIGFIDGDTGDQSKPQSTCTVKGTFPQYITLKWNTPQTFDKVVIWSWFSMDQGPTVGILK